MRDEKAQAAVTAVLKWRGALWADGGENRAARARLRRCGSLGEALFEPRAILLLRRIGEALGPAFSRERAVLLAMVLAEVEAEGKMRLGAVLGQTADGKRPAEDERPRLSPIRFRALIGAARERDWDRFAQGLRRALAVLGHAPFDVGRFVEDILFLNERILQSWTYQYWQSPAPDEPPSETADESSIPEHTP